MRLIVLASVIAACQAQQYIITTVAGGGLPPTPTPAADGHFFPTTSVAVDAAGNIYFSGDNCCVFRVDVGTGLFTRFAGSSQIAGYAGDGGSALNARLNGPRSLTMDNTGNLYIVESGNNVVRKVTPAGMISTVAGNGIFGSDGDGGPATSARLASPSGAAVDTAGNLYIADTGYHRVRKVTPDGLITTLAGTGNAAYSGDGGAAKNAGLYSPNAVALDAAGNLYISDSYNARVRKVAPNGIITTFAGTGTQGVSGDGGPATSAQLNTPDGLAVDGAGNVYIADSGNRDVRKVTTAGTITTVAGYGFSDSSGDGGPAIYAGVQPQAVAIDNAGNLLIADFEQIRKVTPDGIINTIIGQPGPERDSGDGGLAIEAFIPVWGVATDSAGNIYVASNFSAKVRKIGPDGFITTIAGTGSSGYSGDGGPAVNAQLDDADSVAVDASGNLYIGGIAHIRKVTPNGVITTIAGVGANGYSGDGGPAIGAQVNVVSSLAVDSAGNVYFADQYNHRVRKIAPSGIITTVAGNGVQGYGGDGGPASSASLNYPNSMSVDAAGNLYISDGFNNRVRKVAPNGVITTVAGNGGSGFGGDGGLAINAQLSGTSAVAVDAAGSLYIADGNARIRKVSANGLISTVAGNGVYGYSGDGGPALSAALSAGRLALGNSGRIFVGVQQGTIRMLTPMGTSPVLNVTKTHAGNFTAGQNGATYSVAVSNVANAGPTSGLVTVGEILPTGLNFLNMSGIGWTCPSTICTRNDTLNAGDSYPPITVTMNVAADAPSVVINQVSVSGGGAITSSTSDPSSIPAVPNPVLLSPGNAAIGLTVSPLLTWAASAGATSYDVYFGAASSPPLVGNVAVTSFTPATLVPNTTYYWRIVARNGLRSAGSATWSFTSYLTQVRISGTVIIPGVVMTVSGSQSATTITAGNRGTYSFSGLPAGGTYTVTPSFPGYTFDPPSRTYPNISANQTADFTIIGMTCQINSGVPPTVRSAGITELASDVVLGCDGGIPTPAGTVLPRTNITLTLNAPITSRVFSDGSEVFLTIDEPTATQAKVCVPSTANPGAPTDPAYCPVVGTGGSATEFTSGNANIIRGTVSGNSVTFAGVPIDPPGPGLRYIDRVYRITNLRVDASQVAAGPAEAPGQVTGVVQVTGPASLAIYTPFNPVELPLIVAFVQSGLTTSVWKADDTGPLTALSPFQQCSPKSPTRAATLIFAEAFPQAFKKRTIDTTAGGIGAQNVLGLVYSSESGYYNPALPGSAGLAGLGDFGTRVKAVISNIPAGVALYTSTVLTSVGGTPGTGITNSQANLVATDTGPYAAVAATQTLDGIPAAPLPVVNGTATAIWEIVGANPLTSDAYHFPLWIAYSGPATGAAGVKLSYAPTNSNSTIPRFADTSTPSPLFQIASCGATTPFTITTNPAGRTVLLDGTAFTAPQTVQWTPGSSHTIGVVAAAGEFLSWSDGGAQSHGITAPATATTYTATFNTQQLLTTAVAPANSGTVTANPTSPDGYYNGGTSVVLTATPNPGFQFSSWSGDLSGSSNPVSIAMNASHSVVANFSAVPLPSPLQFVTVNPCRVADTRNANGPFGGPAITGQTSRDFVIPNSACGIPATALAYSINVTVVPHGSLGYLTAYPSGQALPLASTLNSLDGRVKANAAIVSAGAGGAIRIFASDTTDVILDINGYFILASGSSTLAFYPSTPCRVADTRGGPFLAGGRSRSFSIRSSLCFVPANVQAYSLNFTAVPRGKLGYITTYPTGASIPLVSTLNAISGQVTANATIVPAGSNGDISVFASDDTDLVIDINGYFAPSLSYNAGLWLYNVTPCRVLDTRNPPASALSATRVVSVAGTCGVPGVAQAYVFNATVVPSGTLGYLSLWPQGLSQPLVSTLNALDGAVTSNMAIVPTNNGSINGFGADPTHLVLDITGYFAP